MAKEIPLTQGKVALVDDADYAYLSQFKWYFNGGGYAARTAPQSLGRGIIYMHRELLKPGKGIVVDHIDGDKLNNRRSNLRIATVSQNIFHSKLSKVNTSGYKGVRWHRQGKKWLAEIKYQRRNIYLGLFDTAEAASAAYNAAAKRLFGEFASPVNKGDK